MRKIVYILLSLLILAGCSSSRKYFQKGQYDAAINKAVKQIRKKPTSRKDIEILEKAYPLANEKDLERIKYLKLEGQPESWDEIFDRYSRLKRRQNLVKTATPIQLPERTINFQFVDYDQEMIRAKENAAECYYAHAKKLYKSNDKKDVRKAYYEFVRVENFYSNYADVDRYIKLSKEKGMSTALVKVENRTHFKLAKRFMDNLLHIDLPRFNTEWVQYYDQTKAGGETFDYNININLNIIDVLPEKVKEEHLFETKEIQDGFQYVLDDNGNVMKDTLGNDIKLPKYKTIKCEVIKNIQSKMVHIEGKVQYIDNYSGQIIKSVPVAADNHFDHISAMAIGDLDALSSKNRKYIGIKPLPFPADGDMIHEASETLKHMISRALRDNRRVLR